MFKNKILKVDDIRKELEKIKGEKIKLRMRNRYGQMDTVTAIIVAVHDDFFVAEYKVFRDQFSYKKIQTGEIDILKSDELD